MSKCYFKEHKGMEWKDVLAVDPDYVHNAYEKTFKSPKEDEWKDKNLKTKRELEDLLGTAKTETLEVGKIELPNSDEPFRNLLVLKKLDKIIELLELMGTKKNLSDVSPSEREAWDES